LGLNFLHEAGFIHRDLKLANVMLRDDGHVVIGDYGLVYDLKDGSPHDVDSDGNPLAMGCCGTKTHMAPEVLADQQYTFSADWWSFGVCIFTMFQGEVRNCSSVMSICLLTIGSGTVAVGAP
jgi:serine/threonine protein kinase